ncbi:hypothetical protein ID866_6708, partial [Astraeus odoratus]
CKEKLESVQTLADTGDLPGAVLECKELSRLLATAPEPLGQASVATDIKRALLVIENRVSELLSNAYSQSLVIAEQHIIVRSAVLVPGSSTLVPLTAVLSSMSPSTLSAQLTTLRRDLTNRYFVHILCHPDLTISITEDDSSGFLVHKLQCLPSRDTISLDNALQNLASLLDFFNNKAFPHLPPSQRHSFPHSLAKPLTTSIMTNLLTPSLPSTLDALPDFLELTGKAVEFEFRYIVNLLGGDSTEREIKSWADNVCAHYERARRISILDTFRGVVLEKAARKGDTFMTELVVSREVVQDYDHTSGPQKQVANISPSAETDAWHLDDDQSFATSSSKSGADDSSWGFDDAAEQVGQTAGHSTPANEAVPKAEAEVDPSDAWGWNDDELSEEGLDASSGEKIATDPTEEDGLWDDDPWADSADANEPITSTNPPVQPARPVVGVSVMPGRTSESSQRETNGHAKLSSSKGLPVHVATESYPVSALTAEVIQTVEVCLREGKSLEASHIFTKLSTSTSPPGTLIMHSGALTLDLYYALYPIVAASRLSQPTQQMQFSNDCYYISEQLGRVLSEIDVPFDVRGKLLESRDDFKVLAESWFHDGIEKQVAALNRTLEGADGFTGTSDQDRYDECEMAVTTILRNIRGAAQAWKPILPKSKYYLAVGHVVDSVLSRILEDILAIPDIPEVESHKLSELCRILSALEGLFVENTDESSFVVSFVPCWLKFSYLSELLEASMADLAYLFEEGALVDFEIEELDKLVRALFADTPLRARTLNKLRDSHPNRS